jgi:hypothetical protein
MMPISCILEKNSRRSKSTSQPAKLLDRIGLQSPAGVWCLETGWFGVFFWTAGSHGVIWD